MLLPAFTEDLMFKNTNIYSYKISQRKVDEFISMVLDKDMPNDYTLELPEFTFRVNQKRREFRILQRNYNAYEIGFGFLSESHVDMAVYISYMTAYKSGFKVFLENKFNN